MLSNLVVNCYNLLILTTFVPSCTVWRIFHVVCVRDRAPGPLFYKMLGQTHVNGQSRVIASQNRGSTGYIFPLD